MTTSALRDELSRGTAAEPKTAPMFAEDDLRWVGRRLSVEESFEFCRALTKSHAKSFYFSSIALPAKKKDAAYAVYAFCRFADDMLDESGRLDAGGSGSKARLRQILAALYQGSTGLPFDAAFRETVERYEIPAALFEELIEGVCMDTGPVRIQDFKELHLYCYRVASVVGLMMSRIFGLKDPAGEERAIQMGVAMQLTNILRDVREDLEMNRIYLPADELARFDVSLNDLHSGKVTGNWRELMQFQIERTRQYYRDGEKGIRYLAADGSRMAVALMSRVYSGILTEIERADYNVFRGRVHVSLPRKLGLAIQAWRDLRTNDR